MKTKKLFLIMLLFVLACAGCKQKEFDYVAMSRDAYNTGGVLSFEYDNITHTAYFGGEGQIVQYYSTDIAKGWTEEGCRVGVTLPLPKGIDDYKSAVATLDEKQLEWDDFGYGEEGEMQYVIFQPIVSEEKSHIILKITWQDGSKEQTYNIAIREGTLFMTDN